MLKIKKRIEIVSSTNKSLSSMGQASRRAVYTILKRHYADVRISFVNNLSDLETLVARRPNLVFLGMKYVPTSAGASKVWLADYLDKAGIAYTGSNSFAHVLELHKNLAKQRVIDAGLQTSPFYLFESSVLPSTVNNPLNYPLFVKPNASGGGVGVDENSIVHNKAQLDAKLLAISEVLGFDSLVEQYLSGREFSVAILKDPASEAYLTMPIELIAPTNGRGERVLTQSIKTADSESSMKVTDLVLEERICEFGLQVFNALGARDYGRIDIRLDANGIPNFLEANLLPSLRRSKGNYFPKACLINEGFNYEKIIMQIAKHGLSRSDDTYSKITKVQDTPYVAFQF